jgi:hypothetical protein
VDVHCTLLNVSKEEMQGMKIINHYFKVICKFVKYYFVAASLAVFSRNSAPVELME